MQFIYFLRDVNIILGENKLRFFILFFTRQFWGLFSYRLDRQLFLLLKKTYLIFRIPLSPFFFILQVISNMDIHYKADIQGGISVWHPAAGIVISGKSVVGKNLTLTGGNFIGTRKPINFGEISIGDNVYLGANAIILGPIKLGSDIRIGALALVVDDCLKNGVTIIGSKAHKIDAI